MHLTIGLVNERDFIPTLAAGSKESREPYQYTGRRQGLSNYPAGAKVNET